MTTAVSNSAELLTEIVQRILITPLQESSTFLSSGVRIFDTDGSPIRVPKINGMTADPAWVGETEQIPTNLDADFGEVNLLARTVKSLAGIATFSESLLRQSVVNVEAAIQAQLVHDFGDTLDATFYAGDGAAGTEPLGMLSWTGTQALLTVGTVSNFDPFIDALGAGIAASVDLTRLQWFMRPETFIRLSKLKDDNNRYQLQPDPSQGGKFRLLGYPITVTKKLPVDSGDDPDVTSVVLADMSTVAVARDRNAQITRLTELYAETQRIGLRVVSRWDVAPLLPEAVIIMRDVTL